LLPWVCRTLSPFHANTKQEDDERTKNMEHMKLRDVLEVVGQFISMVLVLWIMFGRTWGYEQLYYLAFVPIIWIAMRHGTQRVVTGLLVFNFGIVIALKLDPVPANSVTRV